MIRARVPSATRSVAAPIAVIAFLIPGALALAAGTPPKPRQEAPPKPAAPTQPAEAPPSATESRARAEAVYAKGYAEAQEAKKLLADGKTKEAEKRFKSALKKFESATAADESYFEAWNMVGFCARKTGDLKRAFAAYERSLALNPEYEEAHEYLGEAHLMTGDIGKAREQLAWLKSRKSEEAVELEEAIEAVEKASAKGD
jgi:tetratricopeptide (TPR) repeat protein